MNSFIKKLALVALVSQAGSLSAELAKADFEKLQSDYAKCKLGTRSDDAAKKYARYTGLMGIKEQLPKASELQRQDFADIDTLVQTSYSELPRHYKLGLTIKNNKVKTALVVATTTAIIATYAWAKKYPQGSLAGKMNQAASWVASWFGSKAVTPAADVITSVPFVYVAPKVALAVPAAIAAQAVSSDFSQDGRFIGNAPEDMSVNI